MIAEGIWAKLLWAGLNLEPGDLPTSDSRTYPVELIRAITLTWLFAGQRSDEIARLRVGCIRWQHDGLPIPGDSGEVLARDAVCLLDVPTHKTGTAFTKPVDPLVGKAVEAWQAVRPAQLHGKALGWLFGGMAGGIAVGSSAGALAEPAIGWPGLFQAAATGGALLLAVALAARVLPSTPRPATFPPLAAVAVGYRRLLHTARGQRTYAYVLLNAVLHSGIYTWLGLYLVQRFTLGPVGVGLALLGYGIPGFLLGPVIGHLADRYGRARIIPTGVALAAACALLLATDSPLPAVAVILTALSLGYDMTQPPLGGIVTDLPGHRSQAMGLNVFALFTGFGLGSLAFQALLTAGFTVALTAFGATALLAAAVAATVRGRGRFEEVCRRWTRLAAGWGRAVIHIRSPIGFLTQVHAGEPVTSALCDVLAPVVSELVEDGVCPGIDLDYAVLVWVILFGERAIMDLLGVGWSVGRVAARFADSALRALGARLDD
ncbi:MFS transporter [Streptomyces sp. NPDC050743]|uniref:MFS transporter n=1 Tax=Streptomyces sp. NPDC050743 TaxID=3365634 RepID=UPI0037B34A41